MRHILTAALVLAPIVATAAGDYQPDKSAAERAESNCESVMLMTKQDAYETLRNVRAEVTGHHIEGRKVISVRYPYNMKGAGFLCAFTDYGHGRLTLRAFGEIWPDRKNVTRVEPLR